MAKLRDKKINSAASSDKTKLNNSNNSGAIEHQSFIANKAQVKLETDTSETVAKTSKSGDKNILDKNTQALDATTLSKKGEEQKNSVESCLEKSSEEKARKTDIKEGKDTPLDDDYKKIAELMQSANLGKKTVDGNAISYENDDEGVDVNVDLIDEGIEKGKRRKIKKAKHLDSSIDNDKNISSLKITTKRNGKPKKVVKKSFKQRMKTLGVLIVLGVFTGSGLGVWYFNSVLRPNVNYDDYIISDYVVTANEVLESTFGISTNQENWLEDIRTAPQYEQYKDYTPLNLSPAQNFILAEYNATLANTFHAVGNGKVETIVTQSVYSEKNYDGNRYTFESISKGLMSIAICSAMDKGASVVQLYKGSNIQTNDAVWGQPVTYSDDDYIELAGSTPDAIQPYIISDKTILSQTEVMYDEETGYYSFTLELDPVTSVLRYARQVKQTSGLSSYPEFNTVTQTITIDENWNLVSIDVHETYSVVAFGIPASCSGTLLTYYEFNVDDVVLPV